MLMTLILIFKFTSRCTARSSKPVEVHEVAGPSRKKFRAAAKEQAPDKSALSEVAMTLEDESDDEQRDRCRSPKSRVPKPTDVAKEPLVSSEVDDSIQQVWSRRNQGGTGDCAFRCLAAAVHWNSTGEALGEEGSRREGALIRAKGVSHLRKHIKDYIANFARDRDVAPASPTPDAQADYEQYLQQMSGPHTWADGLILQAISARLGTPLVIWVRGSNEWRRVCLAPAFSDDGEGGCFAKSAKRVKPIILLLENSHYTWLQPASGAEAPLQWLRQSIVPDRKELAGAGPKQVVTAPSRALDGFRLGDDTPSVHSLISLSDKQAPQSTQPASKPGLLCCWRQGCSVNCDCEHPKGECECLKGESGPHPGSTASSCAGLATPSAHSHSCSRQVGSRAASASDHQVAPESLLAPKPLQSKNKGPNQVRSYLSCHTPSVHTALGGKSGYSRPPCKARSDFGRENAAENEAFSSPPRRKRRVFDNSPNASCASASFVRTQGEKKAPEETFTLAKAAKRARCVTHGPAGSATPSILALPNTKLQVEVLCRLVTTGIPWPQLSAGASEESSTLWVKTKT